MSMRSIKKGSADQSVVIRIIDSTDGTPETSVVYNTAGIDLWYRREGATKTSITEATLTNLNDAHSDGGVLHIGDGYYRLDLPDAACATGANGVMVGGTVTGMIVIGCYVPLVDHDPYDGVRLGLTALPNAAADAAGGLPISDAGGLDLDAKIGALTFTVAGDVDVNIQSIAGAALNTSSAQIGVNVVNAAGTAWGNGAITADVIANGAIDNATFAADVGSTAYATNIIALAADKAILNTSALATVCTEARLSELDAGTGGKMANQVDIIQTDTTTDIPAILGTPAGASISADIAVIEGYTDDIGVAGAGLTAVPWNASWDAEVQSEVFDALNAEITDATSLTANGLLDRLRAVMWILRNKIEVTDANGNTVIYKDDSITAGFTVNAMLTDNSTTTTRLRAV